jgi:hypothetical protein
MALGTQAKFVKEKKTTKELKEKKDYKRTESKCQEYRRRWPNISTNLEHGSGRPVSNPQQSRARHHI